MENKLEKINKEDIEWLKDVVQFRFSMYDLPYYESRLKEARDEALNKLSLYKEAKTNLLAMKHENEKRERVVKFIESINHEN